MPFGAADDYLQLCEERGTEPEKAYKGTFNIRISPELHKNAALYAMDKKISLNSVVARYSGKIALIIIALCYD